MTVHNGPPRSGRILRLRLTTLQFKWFQWCQQIPTRSSQNQTGLNKTLTPQRNPLLLITIHRIRTTVISLLSLFRGREITCSETKKLRYCCRADQTPRQIKTIWHVVCLTQSGALCHNLLKRTPRYDHLARNFICNGLTVSIFVFCAKVTKQYRSLSTISTTAKSIQYSTAPTATCGPRAETQRSSVMSWAAFWAPSVGMGG